MGYRVQNQESSLNKKVRDMIRISTKKMAGTTMLCCKGKIYEKLYALDLRLAQ
jgi:hypothetical protein